MSTSSEGPLTLGRVIDGRYEVQRVLHSGNNGTVYEAEVLDGVAGASRVALKVLHPRLCVDQQIQGRFEREARILERLDDEHHASLLDYVVEDDLLILALRYVDGPSLAEVLAEQQALPVAQALDIAIELCAALQAAHEADVIHRDLKPSNVLLEGWRRAGDGEKGVRVVDFGLAKILHGDAPGSSLTEQDMIFGTPDYMSPEQVRGDDLDPRADLYAVGAVLFEMLTGEVPYPTAGALTTMTAHLKEPVPSARKRAPSRHIPEVLEDLLARTLAKEPADRFGSAAELAEALREVRRGIGPSEADPPVEGAPASGGAEAALAGADSIGTTMKSPRDAALEAAGRGAKVQVQVLEADPDSAEVTTRRVRPPPAERQWVGERGPVERRIWAILAVIAAATAVGLGVWLGVR